MSSVHVARKNAYSHFLIVEVLPWRTYEYFQREIFFLSYAKITRGKGSIFIGNFGAAPKFQIEYSMLKTRKPEALGNKKQIP